MTTMTKEELNALLKSAIDGDTLSEQNLLIYIKNNIMNRRIGRYLSRNRQVENEDLKQEFMIGVALGIRKCDINMGDPIEYLIAQGVYRVRTCLRSSIIKNTVQVCRECGAVTRLNMVGSQYVCKRCGSNNIETQEVHNNDDITLENAEDSGELVEEIVLSQMLIEQFEATLVDGTNVKNLYELLKSGINRDNPDIANYIKEIAKLWGGCSSQNVMQTLIKLQDKLKKFADQHGFVIVDNKFVEKE